MAVKNRGRVPFFRIDQISMNDRNSDKISPVAVNVLTYDACEVT